MNDPEGEAAIREVERRFYHALRHRKEDNGAALVALWSDADDATTMNGYGGYERGGPAAQRPWTPRGRSPSPWPSSAGAGRKRRPTPCA